jgi:hypothetical protein
VKKFLGLIVFMGLLLSVIVPSVSEAKTAFKDVSSNQRFYDEISYLINDGVISGFKDGTFGPDRVVTRAQAAIMIGRALDLDGAQRSTHFKDVDSTQVASGYIASAVKEGIISGYPDKTYRSDQPVTRGQMAIFPVSGSCLSPFWSYNNFICKKVLYGTILFERSGGK